MSFQPTSSISRLTTRKIQSRVLQGEKIAMLTAYDAITAALLDQCGIDLILVGDSLGNVVLGYPTTIPVTLDDMIRHTAAVVRGTERALIVSDLPFGTVTDPDTALRSAIRVFQETGAQAVKIEGGEWAAPIVAKLVEQGIPVMGHIGLTPQSIHQLGGYHRHGKNELEANRLEDAALALEAAGAFAIVLECLMPEVTARISKRLTIPTIGIGSGPDCDGQVLVINDLIGLGVKPAPSFAKPKADVASVIKKAVLSYIADVRAETQSSGAQEIHGTS
jgi:3-methyl-2-oxobutanoate hydroxymethyltransferase